MNTEDEQFARAEALLREGYMSEARDVLLGLPEQGRVLHLLGVCAAQEQDYDQALEYILQALDTEPEHPHWVNHLGNVYSALERFDEARVAYVRALTLDDQLIDAYNNLGNLYRKLEDDQQAVASYQKALNIDAEFIDANYNLGVLYFQLDKLDQAIDYLKTAYEAWPDNLFFLRKLALAYYADEQYEQGKTLFEKLLESDPDNHYAHLNLGAYYLLKKDYQHAQTHYQALLTLMPKEPLVSYNMGLIATELNQIDEALNYYQASLKLDPDYLPTRINLGNLYLLVGQHEYALKHFNEVLEREPDNEAVKYLVAAINKDVSVTQAPNEYVHQLFDNYADHYDQHLLDTLKYNVPEQLYHLFLRHVQQSTYRILDLGCGTGLCGTLFKGESSELVGVDISGKMLEIAKTKNCYQQLIQADIVSALDQTQGFDVVIAGDVLTYIGDLAPLFSQLKKALVLQGYFLFSIEITDKKDYEIQSTGRFSHHMDYIHSLCEQYGYKVLENQALILRKQAEQNVAGILFMLQRES